MVTIDLITGFLGSGKTTFIRGYVEYLISQGENVCILENDYGAINVDMMLLKDLTGDNCEMEMIIGGDDAQTHARRFRTKLIAMAMSGYTRVIVEPSGVFDVDEFFDLLREAPLDNWYRIGSVLTIVDAGIPSDLSEAAEYLLLSQCADAGRIILSHSDLYPEDRTEAVLEQINRAGRKFHCDRTFRPSNMISVSMKDQKFDLTDEQYRKLSRVEYMLADFVKMPDITEGHFTSLFYYELSLSPEQLEAKTEKLFTDPAFGHVIRVKGFLPTGDDQWIQINANTAGISMQSCAHGQEVIIVIGEELDDARIKAFLTSE